MPFLSRPVSGRSSRLGDRRFLKALDPARSVLPLGEVDGGTVCDPPCGEKVAELAPDMDEPVKPFLFGTATVPSAARWSVGIRGARRLSTVNHPDIR
ncbi:MAG: hypothetical protein ABSF61_10365, partial [Anaerolineales bacterium]